MKPEVPGARVEGQVRHTATAMLSSPGHPWSSERPHARRHHLLAHANIRATCSECNGNITVQVFRGETEEQSRRQEQEQEQGQGQEQGQEGGLQWEGERVCWDGKDQGVHCLGEGGTQGRAKVVGDSMAGPHGRDPRVLSRQLMKRGG